ncbi:dynein heavy chain [Histoplasma capsulatum H143]|uniref:Dynein heavy chain, cytoplasmic n=1 Tax=Ajellomyces capsulatus (strain H143) TaxID=544712 RepID=C6HL08_AJECH|nr:dynein heavy chain [Histoplasma capsulatum H143]
MEVVLPGVPNGLAPPSQPPSVDPATVVQYLTETLQSTLDALKTDLESAGSFLSKAKYPETIQRCSRFASESQVALYVQKDAIELEQTNGTEEGTRMIPEKELTLVCSRLKASPTRYVYILTLELSLSPTTVASMAFTRQLQPLDPNIPISAQVHATSLPGFLSPMQMALNQGTTTASPLQTLHTFVNHVLGPYFDAYTSGQERMNGVKGRGDSDAKTGVPVTKKKIAELKSSLLQLQENIEIPVLNLPLHEVVQGALDQAAARGIKPSTDLIPASVLENTIVLNSIQNIVNGWIKSIQTTTQMSRDDIKGSAIQEINFWLSMETALEAIEDQLRSDGVQLTMDILRHAKRFNVTLSFSADTGLKETAETVQKYNQLMRDFPLDELLSATSLPKVHDALNLIFSHLNKKLRICPYPIKRSLLLVEAISGDLDTQIRTLIHGRSIMHLSFKEFRALMRSAQVIWRAWDENVKEFTNVARDAIRRRNEKFISIKVEPRHSAIQDRLKYINTFRNNHEQLQRTIVNVLGPNANMSAGSGTDGVVTAEGIGDVDALDEVSQAYASLKDVDVLDVSEEGTQIWIQAEASYNERTSRVENSIIAQLKDRLATAKNATEMFRVFSKFNALLVRPKIRSAISIHQSELIELVKHDIAKLHERFKQQYGHSQAHPMAQLRDLPPVSGAIVWARQIERQLDGYMRKNWLQDVQRRNITISGRLFKIFRNRATGNTLELDVNFDPQIIVLFKEVRNLVWLNYQVPHAINTISKEAKRVYPYAISLIESVRTALQTMRSISSMAEVSILLSGYKNDVQALIMKGLPLRWESFIHSYELHIKQVMANGAVDPSPAQGRSESKHVQFVREFAASAFVLQSKTSTLFAINESIQKAITDLRTCPYDAYIFRQRLDEIQNSVDKLNLENYVNLGYWVSNMNKTIELILQERLHRAIREWILAFQEIKYDENGVQRKTYAETSKTANDAETQTYTIEFPKLFHEISMRNQVLRLDPPLEYARASWFAHFDQWVGVLCNLEKIKSARYKMSIETEKARLSETHFTNLPQYCTSELVEVYSVIGARLEDISDYVDKWLQFQSLWDLQASQVYDTLGDDLSRWLQLLQEIRKSRATFDTSEVGKSFGNVRIDYEQVQTKVNARYDQWQHEILHKFGGKFASRMREVHDEIVSAKKDLESQTLEASSTAHAVSFITIVQQCKRKARVWGPEVDLFLQGQATLTRQRYHFPSDWLHVEQVRDDWNALSELLERKSKIVQDQTDALQAKIIAEDRVISNKVAEIIHQWNEEKPVSGSIPPEEASRTLSSFQSRLENLRSESEMVTKAKEALDLPGSPETALAAVLEEVQDFMSVWAALSTIWKSLNELRDVLWNSVQPRKLRQSLDGLIKMTKEMPSRMRQYAAFEHIQATLRQLLKVNPLLSDMKSEAVRERHWQKIFKVLKPGKRFSQISLTLGDVWDLQLAASESVIRDIIAQAQGEMALEEFLKMVRETWQNYSLDLVNYQNKCRLIKGFDDLFAKCSENLNSLQAMKHSPYYKEFEEDASSWEDKLNRVHVLFDVWIDVQRQWVYLEGVFTGNADIKHLLPVESGRFQNINSEFFAVMKKVYKSPFVLDILAIAGVQKSLERLAELLHKIQKALGEYLERERMSFPRFYFVGDEDLLEIIGNSNDTLRVAKHFKKMFAGLSGLLMDDDGNIVGFSSKEGEEVRLKREVSPIKTPRINDWLSALDTNMKLTLAELLAEAIEQFEPIYRAPEVDQTAFSDFLANYPAQIVVLSSQVVWTQAVQSALEGGGSGLPALYDAETFPQRLHVHMANAKLDYGFEYLGVPERLVRTPLTDRCFLTLTQALCQRLGGSPYGPAGTGKTESVKALGLQLGRFTLVFCCDDTFDFQAMGRIFLGICQVGAWGCFDEFNRLEERILSAVSQQIQNIQIGLKNSSDEEKAQIELVGRQLRVNLNTGIFITMNPGYAGRSNLPDNLKKLFRSVAMSKPDKELIAEVMLFSQGFKQAKPLSRQTVPFFEHCAKRLTKQAHYDFGLRALKSVLVSSGGLKRLRLANSDGDLGPNEIIEPQIIVQSIRETIAPKLIREDVETMLQIQTDEFPGVEYVPANFEKLTQAIRDIAWENHYVASDTWIAKTLQLYQIQGIHHGVMMVGRSGAGKSAAWKTLLEAMQRVEGIEGVCHVIDSKVMSKEALYGNLDSTTREWTDGLFTGILRKIVDNLRGEDSKRHWIVFDGDVDPEWVENLNSVLDDNKLLTLPNGERLNLPANVRIMFEVETLKYATLATVSRCGMVWFSDDTVTPNMMVTNYIESLKTRTFEDLDDDSVPSGQSSAKTLETQKMLANLLEGLLQNDDLILKALEEAKKYNHIMQFSDIRALNTLFSLLNKSCWNILEYNIQHIDFPLDPEKAESYMSKKLLLALVWSLTGDCTLGDRKAFGEYVTAFSTIDSPLLNETSSLIDFDVSLPKAEWTTWQSQVPSIEINTHSVTQTDVIIPTLDTVRHEDVLYSWLAEHKPLLLCGPPGSGKTMTLFSALRKLPNMEVVGLNFSSATTPDLLIKTFEQYCEYKKTLNGVVMSPNQIGRWLVIFCDEINLPAPDQYGTQRAISFLRQLVEQNGFWRTTDKTWVTLDRIQFVGACNPPTDAGRTPLGERFLRHAPLIMVDYPGELSLMQIYGTFNSAILKIIPLLRGYSEALTKAMVQFYLESQARFTPQIQPHYVYSPRELTRWVRGVYEAIKPLETLSLEGLVRIWAHEALRLFQDRLVDEDERTWTSDAVKRIALENFPTMEEQQALQAPILFSNWLSKHYVPVEQEQLREFVKARLKTFCEEEVDVPLVLFNDVLEHALRIDRVFRQPQGHLILIGVSGSGKTTLSRFVAWMNGLKVFQIKVHGKYSAEDFDEDLRSVLRRAGCKGEKICFIMDESNVLDSGFLERMNTLLANAEVPGLFEGDEFASLMTACKEGAQRQGLLLDSQEELYKWFTQQIVKNLHVVFTMNPPEDGLSSKAATSPALFNRCVLNWLGDWSDQALFQVGSELTQSVDLDKANFVAPDGIPVAYRGLNLPASHRDTVINSMVYIHYSLQKFNQRLQKQQGRITYLTPRHYLDFVAQYVKLFNEKREDLEEQQRHLNVGLEKLRDTVEKVSELRRSLAEKKRQLEQKDVEANEKLQRMVADQQEAERRKAASLEIQVALEKQEHEVARRKEIVLGDLAKAEPAVLEAQKSVSNIKRQHLTEVRAMGNPPASVRLALESVCTLLGHRVDSWKTIQAIIRRDDFIASIVNYNNEKQMTRSLRNKMRVDYLSKDEFTFERVYHASKACGPLVKWVEAQVNYSEILDRVGPLRGEVDQLEQQALQTKAEAQAIENTINTLESSIATYKTEYAGLISETQAIKTEMSRVQFKVDRSVRLLDSLSSERSRWEEGSKSFETQISTLVGDVLIAAAFLAYGGLYDQQFRKAMIDDWVYQLGQSGISFKPHNPITEYLSNADERLSWQDHSLPVDDLCTENAIILKRFNRYPLIIDPSGRVTEFLQKESKDRKLTVTSFLDDSFIKQLESALRFGNPILIQDAEYLDPILNHVLNKEYQKTGGRVLIQLGRQEIDFSPAFKLFLSTRDPSATFAPDICSRTTFVNFTVTQSSLQTQSLNEVLKFERPDVDERRTNLIKLQGEFKIHLRQLEKRLLQALNESRGNILDDDNVIETLETLKKEAGEISNKMVETEGVMTEVENITLQYNIIARSCSAVFAVLEQLHHLNHFYQFSLQYFVDIFNTVLHQNKHLAQEKDHSARVNIILRDLFITAYQRTSLGLLQKDRITLAMLLAQASPYSMDKGIIDTILDTSVEGCDVSLNKDLKDSLMATASQMSLFSSYLPSVTPEAWERFLSEEFAENFVPTVWEEGTSPRDQQLRSLLLVKLFRIDRFVPTAENFVTEVFGRELFESSGDLKDVVEQVTATAPISLSSSPGFDASYKVDGLVERMHATCANIAMGSNEGVESADKAISNAAATGTWVLVKNVHLAPSWLQSLEKRLDSLKPHSDFRLFLSMESSPKILASKPPVEKARIYLLLSFLHAVVQERLRYAPSLGWKGFWEFNDSDYECSAFIIDTWVDSIAQGRSNVAPQKFPWDLLRTLITETYGGKIDDSGDFQLLNDLVNSILTPAAFEDEHNLVAGIEDDDCLKLPSGTSMRDFVEWVNRLPEREPPTYLGLPANAEKLLLVGYGKTMIENLAKVTNLLDEGEQLMVEATAL